MARNPLTRALLWCVPVAAVFTFLWYRKKKFAAASDPGGASRSSDSKDSDSSSDEEDFKNLVIHGTRKPTRHTEKIVSPKVTEIVSNTLTQSQENSQGKNLDCGNHLEESDKSFTEDCVTVMEETPFDSCYKESVTTYCNSENLTQKKVLDEKSQVENLDSLNSLNESDKSFPENHFAVMEETPFVDCYKETVTKYCDSANPTQSQVLEEKYQVEDLDNCDSANPTQSQVLEEKYQVEDLDTVHHLGANEKSFSENCVTLVKETSFVNSYKETVTTYCDSANLLHGQVLQEKSQMENVKSVNHLEESVNITVVEETPFVDCYKETVTKYCDSANPTQSQVLEEKYQVEDIDTVNHLEANDKSFSENCVTLVKETPFVNSYKETVTTYCDSANLLHGQVLQEKSQMENVKSVNHLEESVKSFTENNITVVEETPFVDCYRETVTKYCDSASLSQSQVQQEKSQVENLDRENHLEESNKPISENCVTVMEETPFVDCHREIVNTCCDSANLTQSQVLNENSQIENVNSMNHLDKSVKSFTENCVTVMVETPFVDCHRETVNTCCDSVNLTQSQVVNKKSQIENVDSLDHLDKSVKSSTENCVTVMVETPFVDCHKETVNTCCDSANLTQSQVVNEKSQIENVDSMDHLDESVKSGTENCVTVTENCGTVMEETPFPDCYKETVTTYCEMETDLKTLPLETVSLAPVLDKGEDPLKPEEIVESSELTVMEVVDTITAGVSCLGLTENNTDSSVETSTKEEQKINEKEVLSVSSVAVVCFNEVPKSSDTKKETLVKELEEGACGGVSTDPVSVPVAERDSANHSPADVMLNSPAVSHYSDHHSERSSDSGKGCSYVATPPSRTPASCSSLSGENSAHCVYEFLLPQQLVGRLIGRHGTYVHQLKVMTRANILVKRHPTASDIKICAVEGTRADIDAALKMIREKFPERRYPNVTLEQVSFVPPVPTVPLAPEYSHLHLVEGVNNDVFISTLISPSHFFLQQPTHPTYLALNQLNNCMTMCYNESDAPPLPAVEGTICAVLSTNGWYRAQVIAVDPDADTCDVQFVDYGGFASILKSNLRQIRSDFMALPFQAAECYLAHVIPPGGESDWSPEAMDYVSALTQNQVLQAQVCGYAEDGIPVVYLFARLGPKVIPIHQELVAQGLAEWWEPAES